MVDRAHVGVVGRALVAAVLLTACFPQPTSTPSGTATWTRDGFQLDRVLDGLTLPTSVAFTTSGHVFVAEKRGTIQAFDAVGDTTPSLAADLRGAVYEHADRGLLGLTADPLFDTTRPFLYAAYSADPPLFGDNPNTTDSCQLDSNDGCVIRSAVVRIEIDRQTLAMVGQPTVLTDNYCGQYASHSIGDVVIGADGALYASSGEGASFTNVDYGQLHGATLANPCDSAPTGVGTLPAPPDAAGGALRAQSAAVVHPGFSPVFSGAVIRIDPDTGDPLPTNPWATDPDHNRASIVGYGFRNPFRIAARPGTEELWVADVGWHEWEELDVVEPGAPAAQNFGWPCVEGPGPQPGYQAVGLALCQRLYDDPSLLSAPQLTYRHGASVVAGDGCPRAASSSATGLAFWTGGSYPAAYTGGLFFSDYSRGCTWFAPQGADGRPDFGQAKVMVRGLRAVDLEVGPGGDVFLLDHTAGTLTRLVYDTNGHPTAVIDASTTHGAAPLTVDLDARHSRDPDAGDILTYAWDLDDDGTFETPGRQASVTFNVEGVHTVRLRVTDSHGATATASTQIEVGDQYPVVSIDDPTPGFTWASGDTVSFAGSATDPQDGPLPATAFTWEAIVHHCTNGNTNDCHLHPLETWEDVTAGSFVAPDHEHPSYLELRLTVTDSQGNSATTSRTLESQVIDLQVLSDPPGATVVIGEQLGPTPLHPVLIRRSPTTVLTAEHQVIGGVPYVFAGWSDGGAIVHQITPDTSGTLIATFVPE